MRLVSHDVSTSILMLMILGNKLGAGGLPTLAQLVSLEMAPIRCNVILLGPVRTELLEKLGPGSEEWFKSIAAKTTIGRIPSPHEP